MRCHQLDYFSVTNIIENEEPALGWAGSFLVSIRRNLTAVRALEHIFAGFQLMFLQYLTTTVTSRSRIIHRTSFEAVLLLERLGENLIGFITLHAPASAGLPPGPL